MPKALAQAIRDYRFMAVALALTLPLGILEATRTDLPGSSAEVPPEWLLNDQNDLPKTLVELYPGRSYGHFLRAYQAGMCWDQAFAPAVCQRFTHRDLRDVQDALQQAIQRGGASDQEKLYHFYAHVLVQRGESPEQIEQAIQLWHKHYPYSSLPDPRRLPRMAQPSR